MPVSPFITVLPNTDDALPGLERVRPAELGVATCPRAWCRRYARRETDMTSVVLSGVGIYTKHQNKSRYGVTEMGRRRIDLEHDMRRIMSSI